MPGPDFSVFLCYSRNDERFVLDLAEQLRNRGANVWLDQWAIKRGMDWDRAIDEGLSQCACLVVILSQHSVASEEVRGELRTALDGGKPIVPVLLEPCNVPRRLRLLQHVDLTSKAGILTDEGDRVFAAIGEVLRAPVSTERAIEQFPLKREAQVSPVTSEAALPPQPAPVGVKPRASTPKPPLNLLG